MESRELPPYTPEATERKYTIEDIYALPEGKRAELIDGKIYYQASPNRIHQEMLGELFGIIRDYVKSKGGPCKVYLAPFAVFLFGDDSTYVEPDISVVCDPDKLNEKGCSGAPDWIIEIISPSTAGHDYIRKLSLYQTAGVREYWIVDPKNETVMVYYFGGDEFLTKTYTFNDKVKVNLYEDLTIDFAKIE